LDLKILFVSSGPSDDSTAYTVRLLSLKKGLEQLGVTIDILFLGDYFLQTPELIQLANMPSFLKHMRTHNIIHGGHLTATYVSGMTKSFLNAKLVYDVHGDMAGDFRLCRRSRIDLFFNYKVFEAMIMEPLATRLSDYFITCSYPLKELYLNKGIEACKIEVIRNGVDTEIFKPGEESTKGEKFTVTYAGAFQKWQTIDLLVDAAKLLEIHDIRFRLIGFEREDFLLKETIRQRLGHKAELIDRLPQTELIRQLQKSDILIIPRGRQRNLSYAFPTKFAEYIAIGKPVIVTDVDETSRFVKRFDCGFVCEPTAESIANTIKEVKASSSTVLTKKGQNARKLAESEFDQMVISKRYFTFLTKIAEEI
jgi:glycosyltransferase involved in cell wall biosynthesis